MPDLGESPNWEGVYQIETTDPVQGGAGGIDNQPHQELVNRTGYLKQQHESHDHSGASMTKVVTDGIADDAVTQAKIAAGAVGTTEIANSAVDTNQLASNAVTSTKLAIASVYPDNITSNAVTNSKINAEAVTEAKIGAAAVTEAKINTAAVTETKIGNFAVTESKLGSGAVTTAKIANSTVTAAKILNGIPVAFKARLASAQTIESGGGGERIEYGAEKFDTDSAFNITTNDFKAPIAGQYSLTASAHFASLPANTQVIISIRLLTSYIAKNIQYSVVASEPFMIAVTTVVDAAADDEYFITIEQDSGSDQSLSQDASGNINFFTGHRIAFS